MVPVDPNTKSGRAITLIKFPILAHDKAPMKINRLFPTPETSEK